MQSVSPNVFTRDDTIFGVCQALGEDFRFNPVILRVVFSLGVFVNARLVIGAYLALGVVVLISRLLVRNPRPAAVPREPVAAEAPTAEPTPARCDNDREQEMAAAA